MRDIKLVALDVDGTLVRRDLSLSPAVIRAVESLRDAGVAVAIVTGRTMQELVLLRKELPWIRYFVLSNGATGWDTETDTVFYQNHLPLAIAREVERETRQINRIEPSRDTSSTQGAATVDKASSRGSGGRRTVLAAIEAILVANRVPEKRREAIMVAASEKLAERIRNGQAPKVKIYDKAAPSQRTVAVPTPERQRSRDRSTPAPAR